MLYITLKTPKKSTVQIPKEKLNEGNKHSCAHPHTTYIRYNAPFSRGRRAPVNHQSLSHRGIHDFLISPRQGNGASLARVRARISHFFFQREIREHVLPRRLIWRARELPLSREGGWKNYFRRFESFIGGKRRAGVVNCLLRAVLGLRVRWLRAVKVRLRFFGAWFIDFWKFIGFLERSCILSFRNENISLFQSFSYCFCFLVQN